MTGDAFRQAVDHPAFTVLDSVEYEHYWGLVDVKLGFHPSTRPSDWPSFREPEDSIKWSVAPLLNDFAERFVDAEIELATQLTAAAGKVRGSDYFLVSLDWQHPGYRFVPEEATPPTRETSWSIPVLPDGDYYLYLAADLRFGWLTHPWEQTVCCYGDLLAEMHQAMDRLDLPILRRSGIED